MEKFVSVDIETSGPIPGEYSLLQIGACLVDSPHVAFKCLLKPVSDNADPEALRVTGLRMADLAKTGIEPASAMALFSEWLESAVGGQGAPVFVGLNAPFDWSFVNYYFVRFLGRNPFGISALDIKSLYMGVTGRTWADTRSDRMAAALGESVTGDHDALNDALYQARLFQRIRSLRAV